MAVLTLAALKLVLCASQLKLASVGFTQVGLSDAQATFYADHFAARLAATDEAVRVVTQRDIADVLGVERQKQLMGCSDDASNCMAELAGALGVDGLVTGQVAKIGKSFQVNVKVLAADGSKTMFVHSSALLATEEALVEELNAVAVKLLARVRDQTGGSTTSAPSAATSVSAPPGRGLNGLKLIPGGLGVVGLGLGVTAMIVSAGQYGTLTGQNVTSASHALQLRDDGKKNLVIGSVLGGVGLALVIGSLLWWLLS